MTLSRIGRFGMASVVSVALGLGMTACGGGTIGYMWVLGTQANAAAGQQSGQIAGFKIDDFTGNLTNAINSPFASGGTNPVSIAVKPGGRYVYVVNEGVPATSPTTSPSVEGNISVFSVGGDGTLTFQNSATSQGHTPVWAAVDGTGAFLYVLDQRSFAYDGKTNLNGDITVFSIAADTGRLSLVTNAQVKDPTTGNQLTYFEVGPTPTMMRVSSGGCLFTVDQGNNTIFPYSIGTNGQLTITTNSNVQVSSGTGTNPVLTSISASGSNVYLTDSANNLLLPYTVGTNCALNTLTGGSISNLSPATNPVYSFTETKGLFLYVLNQSTTSTTTPNSSVSAFTILPNSQIERGVSNNDPSNPYPVGSGPVCMAEDPSNQYVYISNNVAGTVTGKQINNRTGQLSDLARGSTFPATGHATCLAISGNVQ